MTDDETNALFDRLDLVMSSTPSNVGVAMGTELFGECHRRKLIEIKTFSVLGAGLFPHDLPTYRGINFAFANPFLPDWEFQIGKPANG
jgi:hypothetical protein